MDGHTSHLTMASSEFASQNGIILISLFPNSTHILQPLDVAVFGPLKAQWRKVICQWRIENNGNRLSRDIFAQLLKTTLDNMKHLSDIIKNGFRTCGLFPLNPDNINYKKYFKNTTSNSQSIINEREINKLVEFLNFLKKKIHIKWRNLNVRKKPGTVL